ncbi:MAG: hypothetical protein R3D29_13935 [Nitratireductor sp.]
MKISGVTRQSWSVDQAERYVDSLSQAFDTIAAMLEIARERRFPLRRCAFT